MPLPQTYVLFASFWVPFGVPVKCPSHKPTYSLLVFGVLACLSNVPLTNLRTFWRPLWCASLWCACQMPLPQYILFGSFWHPLWCASLWCACLMPLPQTYVLFGSFWRPLWCACRSAITPDPFLPPSRLSGSRSLFFEAVLILQEGHQVLSLLTYYMWTHVDHYMHVRTCTCATGTTCEPLIIIHPLLA